MAAAEEHPSNEPLQAFTLSTTAARQLTTTTKSAPQIEGLTSRWLLKILPWVPATGGAYRVNRVMRVLRDGQVAFINRGATVHIIPETLSELAFLNGFNDHSVLNALAGRFTQQEFKAGDEIATHGTSADQFILMVHGKANKIGPGAYDDQAILSRLAGGDYFGEDVILESKDQWLFTVKATTRCIVLSLSRKAFEEAVNQSPALKAQIEQFKSKRARSDQYGQPLVDAAAGHTGMPTIPATFVDYEIAPREYVLSVAQTILRIHTRVADLYNDPMNQTEQQLKLTVDQIHERQEHELINNPDFGLLHNADFNQRLYTRSGPPTPDDLDELITRRRDPQFILAHPRAIAAFGRECNRLGIYPQHVAMDGYQVLTWRGLPFLPCSKIPITETKTTSILVLRVGEQNQGVIGLNPTSLPDEYEPGLNVRFMGIDDKAIISYLVSAYFSVAVLVPDALGILEDVEVGR